MKCLFFISRHNFVILFLLIMPKEDLFFIWCFAVGMITVSGSSCWPVHCPGLSLHKKASLSDWLVHW